MDKNALIATIQKMSSEDIETLLTALEVELKERYYASDEGIDEQGNYGVYYPQNEFETMECPTNAVH